METSVGVAAPEVTAVDKPVRNSNGLFVRLDSFPKKSAHHRAAFAPGFR